MFSKGEEGNKALISFLNAFLEDSYGKIKKAEILNTELILETEKYIYRDINRKGRKALSLRSTPQR